MKLDLDVLIAKTRPGRIQRQALRIAFALRKTGTGWDTIEQAARAVQPGVSRTALISALAATHPEENPSPPAALRAKLDAVTRRYARWCADESEGWGGGGSTLDCQYASKAVGTALEEEGHAVRIVAGDALGTDAEAAGMEEPETHYWLEVDGFFYDPKERVLQDANPSIRYTQRIKTGVVSLEEGADWEDDPDRVLPLLRAAYRGRRRSS